MQSYDFKDLMKKLVDDIEAYMLWLEISEDMDSDQIQDCPPELLNIVPRIKKQLEFMFDGFKPKGVFATRKYFYVHFDNEKEARLFAEEAMKQAKIFHKCDVEKPIDVDEDSDYHVARLRRFKVIKKSGTTIYELS